MNVSLARALRVVIRADSDPARQALFANLMAAHLRVRVVYRLHQALAGSRAAGLMVSCYGLASFASLAPPRSQSARVFVVARHANARRQAARVVEWVGAAECAWVRLGARAAVSLPSLAALVTLASAGGLGRTLRLVRVIERRYGFLVSCRAASAIGFYARALAMLRSHGAGAVLVSSDSNPEEAGVLGAARALGVPQVFVSHAYPTPLSPPLDFSLSILEGEAAVRARQARGPIAGAVLLAGVEGESQPLDPSRFARPNPVIGVFTPKAVSWPVMAAIIEDCRRHFRASKIVIRWHPSMLEPPRLSHAILDRSGIEESPRGAPLPDVARQCDWVIADQNSNVHLPVLKLGIPTVAVASLGIYPKSRADQYGFVASGIVLPPTDTIGEVTPEAVTTFFSGWWAARFQEYDASYLRSSDAVAADVRRAVLSLVDDATACCDARIDG